MLQPVDDLPAYVALFDRYLPEGQSYADVSAAAGVKSRTSENWFNGKTTNPPLIGMVRIAAVLQIPPEEFFAVILGEEPARTPSRVDLIEDRLARIEMLEELRSVVARDEDDPPSDQAPESDTGLGG